MPNYIIAGCFDSINNLKQILGILCISQRGQELLDAMNYCIRVALNNFLNSYGWIGLLGLILSIIGHNLILLLLLPFQHFWYRFCYCYHWDPFAEMMIVSF